MSDSFGLKIGVEGEKEFKKALSDINSSFKVLGSEMKLVESQFDKQDKSIKSITSRNEVLNKQIASQAEKVELLKKALTNATDSFGENDRRTKAWATQLNNAQAALNKMERELEKNEDALEDVADDFENAEKEADDFADELKRTGKQADSSADKFKKLGSVVKGMAVAIGSAMAAIGVAAVKAGKELYEMVNDVAATGDEIDKMSQRLGLSRKAYQEWDYVLSQSGVDINNVQVGMKTLTNTIDDARKGTGSAVERFTKLGISMDDLESKSREEIFKMTITGLQNMTDETEKAALANDLFGRSGQEMLPLLNQTSESTQELIDKAHEMGLVLSDEAVDAAVNYTDAMDTLQKTFSGVKNQITSQLLPGFTMVIEGLSALLMGQEGAEEKIQQGAKNIVATLTEVLPQVMNVILNLVMAIAEIAPQIIVALIDGIINNLDSLIETASSIVMTLITALIEALPQITEGALQLVFALVYGILDNLPLIIERKILTIQL